MELLTIYQNKKPAPNRLTINMCLWDCIKSVPFSYQVEAGNLVLITSTLKMLWLRPKKSSIKITLRGLFDHKVKFLSTSFHPRNARLTPTIRPSIHQLMLMITCNFVALFPSSWIPRKPHLPKQIFSPIQSLRQLIFFFASSPLFTVTMRGLPFKELIKASVHNAE